MVISALAGLPSREIAASTPPCRGFLQMLLADRDRRQHQHAAIGAPRHFRAPAQFHARLAEAGIVEQPGRARAQGEGDAVALVIEQPRMQRSFVDPVEAAQDGLRTFCRDQGMIILQRHVCPAMRRW